MPAAYTSQVCSQCGALSQRRRHRFRCHACGLAAHADVNAAINIRNSSQCTKRRIGDQATLAREIAAWEMQRNAQKATVDWRFTTTTARKALKCLYPA